MVEKRREVSLTEQSWSHVKKDMIGGKPVAHLKLKCLVILRIQSYTVPVETVLTVCSWTVELQNISNDAALSVTDLETKRRK